MAAVVNLRLARKRKARADKERQAAENRALHGRSKAEKRRDRKPRAEPLRRRSLRRAPPRARTTASSERGPQALGRRSAATAPAFRSNSRSSTSSRHRRGARHWRSRRWSPRSTRTVRATPTCPRRSGSSCWQREGGGVPDSRSNPKRDTRERSSDAQPAEPSLTVAEGLEELVDRQWLEKPAAGLRQCLA